MRCMCDLTVGNRIGYTFNLPSEGVVARAIVASFIVVVPVRVSVAAAVAPAASTAAAAVASSASVTAAV